MPVLTFHLVASAYPTEALGALLVEASTAFAAALYPELVPVPVERVRAQINAIAPEHFAAGSRPNISRRAVGWPTRAGRRCPISPALRWWGAPPRRSRR